MKNALYHDTVASPIGKVLLAVSDRGLFLVHYPLQTSAKSALEPYTRAPWLFHLIASLDKTAEARRQLELYFRGELREFTLPLDLRGTPFQRKVWAELQKLTLGQTTTYGELAQRIGQPKAARAVGMANNKNRLGIVVPCHRVIGADGRLTGYAAGLGIKSRLLRHEAKMTAAGAHA